MAWTIRQMDDFAGWPVWGWLSPGGIPCLNPVFRLGPFGSACGPCREAAPLLGISLVTTVEERRTMRHAKQQTQTNGPFLKTALVLWVSALCGVFLVLPYAAALENSALAAAAARPPRSEGIARNLCRPNRGSSGDCGGRWSMGSVETPPWNPATLYPATSQSTLK